MVKNTIKGLKTSLLNTEDHADSENSFLIWVSAKSAGIACATI